MVNVYVTKGGSHTGSLKWQGEYLVSHCYCLRAKGLQLCTFPTTKQKIKWLHCMAWLCILMSNLSIMSTCSLSCNNTIDCICKQKWPYLEEEDRSSFLSSISSWFTAIHVCIWLILHMRGVAWWCDCCAGYFYHCTSIAFSRCFF